MHFIPKRDRVLEKHFTETPESPDAMNVQSRKGTSSAIKYAAIKGAGELAPAQRRQRVPIPTAWHWRKQAIHSPLIYLY